MLGYVKYDGLMIVSFLEFDEVVIGLMINLKLYIYLISILV